LTRSQRIAVETMTAVLAPMGVRSDVEPGGKHLMLLATAPNGRWMKVSIASSPRSDDRCVANWARQDANALLRAFGLMAGDPFDVGPAKPRRQRNRTQPRRGPAFTRPACDPTRDPWTALGALYVRLVVQSQGGV
jgi:hypothetical protein